MMPLVSVAVITYNMERYLPALLDSILKQNVNFSYEIMIDDDCSPDNSREIIRDYQCKYPDIIKPIFRDVNVGGSRNMFGVMNSCRGKYIAILEGDDYWEDANKLQYQVDFLETHPDYICMTCNSYCEHSEISTSRYLMRDRKNPKIFTFEDFKKRSFHDRLPSSTDSWVFRNFFKDGGDYSIFYNAHKMIWDQSLILILYGKGIVYSDPKVVSHHRSISKKDGTNYQSIITQKNCLYNDSKMYQIMEEYIENKLNKRCKQFYYVRGDVWVEAKFRALKTKDKEDIEIAKKIYKDQKRKGMLLYLFIAKSFNIVLRKLRLIK